MFKPGLEDGIFRKLGEEGLHLATHFSTGGRWKTHRELSDPNCLFRLDFLRTLQLRHFLNSIPPPPAENTRTLTTLETILTETGTLTHTLAYGLMNTPPSDFVPPGLLKWEIELDCRFNDIKRQRILGFTHKSPICAKIQETNYKILSRWYRTPELLHKFSPTIS